MEFGPYTIGLANSAGDVLARVTADNDGNEWQTLKSARVHIGTKLLGGTGRLFILDRDGDIVEEIPGDGPEQIAAHDAYDAYMAPERAERAAAGRRMMRQRMEIRQLETLYQAS